MHLKAFCFPALLCFSSSQAWSVEPPVIVESPRSEFVEAGQTALLSVSASGSLPLAYHWQKNGTNLIGETNVSLSLTNVQTSSAGGYRAMVSNSTGTAAGL